MNVTGSFHRTTLETVKFFTGKKVTRAQLNQWKNRPGFNDDWKLSTAWVQSLGGKHEYDEVKAKFVDLYWGTNGKGYVNDEKWLLPRTSLRRLAKRFELAIFTGRTRREMDYTLTRVPLREFFSQVITVEDVERPKPDPGGLLRILNGRDPGIALYVGDNVDDANASKSAQVPFRRHFAPWRKASPPACGNFEETGSASYPQRYKGLGDLASGKSEALEVKM